jgi:transcriptional regulator with XRE-family HTH domain
MSLHAKQIKAARAMLGWGQRKFAKATGLSFSTVRRLEDGSDAARGKTYEAIRRAVEENGLEFTELDGVRTRPRGLQVFEGLDATEQFFEHLQRTVRETGGEILVISPTFATLMQCFGASASKLDPVRKLSGTAPIKCLLWDSPEAPPGVEGIGFRAVSRQQAWPTPYFIYADRLCFSMWDDGTSLRFIVVQSPTYSGHWGSHFFELWEGGSRLKQARRGHKR